MLASPAMGSSKSIPKDVVCRFTQIEIDRFTIRVVKAEQGVRGYNLHECKKYLNIWQSVRDKDYDWERLTEEERSEVLDALDDDEHG